MKITIQDVADQELRQGISLIALWATSALGSTESGGSGQTPTDEKAKPNDSPEAAQTASSAKSGQNRLRHVVPVSAVIGLVFSGYAIFCLVFLLPLYPSDYYEDLELPFTAGTNVLLFCIAFCYYIWTATKVLQWRQVTRFESTVFQSPLTPAALWVACAVVQLNGSLLDVWIFPFYEHSRDIDLRVFSLLHMAFEQSLLGKIIFWTLFVMVTVGQFVILLAFTFIKIWSVVSVASFINQRTFSLQPNKVWLSLTCLFIVTHLYFDIRGRIRYIWSGDSNDLLPLTYLWPIY